jgi:hypothetical protein
MANEIADNCRQLSRELHWDYLGPALERGAEGEYDASVTGDPCIVLDEERSCYHMFYFAQNHDQRRQEINGNAHAVSRALDQVGASDWLKLGLLRYSNPETLPAGQASKPWILMDPHHPNRAIRIDGTYRLFTVSFDRGHKSIWMAVAFSLDGPWTVQPEPVLRPGKQSDFDGYHVDTVTAYWFGDMDLILLFYKGYPATPQADQPLSPWGSSLAAAVMRPGDRVARKLGKIITAPAVPGHWLCGWVSGLQLVPDGHGAWYGLMSGSPTPPVSVSEEPEMREPAPSLGGWAHTAESWPISGWIPEPLPIRTIADLPEPAVQAGMGTNLWRHHLLVTDALEVGSFQRCSLYLFHNSGAYGQERLFVWRSR